MIYDTRVLLRLWVGLWAIGGAGNGGPTAECIVGPGVLAACGSEFHCHLGGLTLSKEFKS